MRQPVALSLLGPDSISVAYCQGIRATLSSTGMGVRGSVFICDWHFHFRVYTLTPLSTRSRMLRYSNSPGIPGTPQEYWEGAAPHKASAPCWELGTEKRAGRPPCIESLVIDLVSDSWVFSFSRSRTAMPASCVRPVPAT